MTFAWGAGPGRAIWLGRMLWAVVGASGWIAVRAALDGRATSAAWAVGVVAVVVVAVVVVAVVVPSTVSLTVVRMVAPATVPVAFITLAMGSGAARGAAFLGAAVVNALAVAGGDTGEAYAQASAYGDEHRFPLRPPVAFLVPVVASWVVWCAALIGAPLLVGAHRWVLGFVVGVLAASLTWFVAPRYHRLSRRWLVVVPAGLVLHDHLVLADTVLLQRRELARVGLARADSEAADLTGPAGGHVLDVAMRDSVKVVLAGGRSGEERAIHARSMLIAPTRPGRALVDVARRGLPVA